MRKLYLLKSIILLLYFAVIFLSALFLSSSSVFASDVVINEFLVDPDSDQWVELYNKSSSAVDIGGWFIDDSTGTEKFVIPNGLTISPGEFKVFESTYFNLNRATADTIKLLNGSSLEDSYFYNTGPGVNYSFGRDVDGTGNWVIFSSPTKGSTNNNSTSVPTPTFTSTPTVTPTKTPTPTPTLKPTSTPKPTPTTKPTTTSKPSSADKTTTGSTQTPTQKRSENSFVSEETKSSDLAKNSGSESAMPTSILGESTLSAKENLASGSASSNEKFLASSQNNFSKALVGLGIIIFLSSCGILAFRAYKGKHESNSNNI
ncbi:MAG: lamin tail domain-containing protein [bacterium]|nr:lamin tail domain-containing protein [bacterium]